MAALLERILSMLAEIRDLIAGIARHLTGNGGGNGGNTNPPVFNGPIPDQTWPEDSAIAAFNTGQYFSNVQSFTVAGTLPPGLVFDPATGNFTGTPTTPGTYSCTVTAVNANGSVTSNTFTKTITAVVLNPPVFSGPIPNQTCEVGQAANIDFSVYFTGATSYSISPTPPSGLVFDMVTGILSGTPTTAQNATSYTVTATNADGSTASNAFTKDVTVVLNHGEINFTSPTFPVNENPNVWPITASRINGTDGVVGATWTLLFNGAAVPADVVSANTGQYNWLNGDNAVKDFQIEIFDDNIVENIEDLMVVLSAPTGGATIGTINPTTRIDIFDNDVAAATPVVQLASAAPITVNEVDGTVTIEFVIDVAPTTALTVPWSATPGLADQTPAVDFSPTSGNVTFPAGSTVSQFVTINIDDAVTDLNTLEDFLLSIGAGTGYTLGANQNVTINIIDDEITHATPELTAAVRSRTINAINNSTVQDNRYTDGIINNYSTYIVGGSSLFNENNLFPDTALPVALFGSAGAPAGWATGLKTRLLGAINNFNYANYFQSGNSITKNNIRQHFSDVLYAYLWLKEYEPGFFSAAEIAQVELRVQLIVERTWMLFTYENQNSTDSDEIISNWEWMDLIHFCFPQIFPTPGNLALHDEPIASSNPAGNTLTPVSAAMWDNDVRSVSRSEAIEFLKDDGFSGGAVSFEATSYDSNTEMFAARAVNNAILFGQPATQITNYHEKHTKSVAHRWLTEETASNKRGIVLYNDHQDNTPNGTYIADYIHVQPSSSFRTTNFNSNGLMNTIGTPYHKVLVYNHENFLTSTSSNVRHYAYVIHTDATVDATPASLASIAGLDNYYHSGDNGYMGWRPNWNADVNSFHYFGQRFRGVDHQTNGTHYELNYKGGNAITHQTNRASGNSDKRYPMNTVMIENMGSSSSNPAGTQVTDPYFEGSQGPRLMRPGDVEIIATYGDNDFCSIIGDNHVRYHDDSSFSAITSFTQEWNRTIINVEGIGGENNLTFVMDYFELDSSDIDDINKRYRDTPGWVNKTNYQRSLEKATFATGPVAGPDANGIYSWNATASGHAAGAHYKGYSSATLVEKKVDLENTAPWAGTGSAVINPNNKAHFLSEKITGSKVSGTFLPGIDQHWFANVVAWGAPGIVKPTVYSAAETSSGNAVAIGIEQAGRKVIFLAGKYANTPITGTETVTISGMNTAGAEIFAANWSGSFNATGSGSTLTISTGGTPANSGLIFTDNT